MTSILAAAKTGARKDGRAISTCHTIGRSATDPPQHGKDVYVEYQTLTFRDAAMAMRHYYNTLYGRLARFRAPENDAVLLGRGEDGKLRHCTPGKP